MTGPAVAQAAVAGSPPVRIGLLGVAVAALAGAAGAPAWGQAASTCYVRAAVAPATEPGASAPAPGHVGIRRKSDKLFDVDIAVRGDAEATCSVSGVAKLQGEPGAEVLGLVVRPDPSRKSGRTGTLCQVFIRLSPAGVELATTPGACQAQALCEGKVELNGQRFEHASRLPAGERGPCFDREARAR